MKGVVVGSLSCVVGSALCVYGSGGPGGQTSFPFEMGLYVLFAGVPTLVVCAVFVLLRFLAQGYSR